VIESIHTKMVRRHPHVFGAIQAKDSAAVLKNWEQIKAEERAEASGNGRRSEASTGAAKHTESILAGVPRSLPAVLEAYQLTRRAARIGFDWPDARPVFDKLKEEIAELESELQKPPERRALEDEMGDILFAAANLARKLDIDPETALRRATAKFERRFRRVETLAAERAADSDLDTLEALWQHVKREEY